MNEQTESEALANTISVALLQENDLPTADYIMRLAFGTFLGLPDPAAFMGDAAYVWTRRRADPAAAFAAQAGPEIVGSNFATNWGSAGFFGPLTIRPDLWDRGIGKRLMEPVMECFERWGTRHAGLFTFAQSAKHVCMYQKFGFWPRFLTSIMSKPVEPKPNAPRWTRFSEVPEHERERLLAACRRLTDAIFEGLDVGLEIRSVAHQELGETVLLWNEDELAGFAVCHCGPGTEAGSGTCYVKFGAVRSGSAAGANFHQLLDACEAMSAEENLARLVAGVNTGRLEAYRAMLGRGFRTDFQGVAMHRLDESGYNRPDVYVIDDWR
jgi:GNAT superfamily N-acetyltransferase